MKKYVIFAFITFFISCKTTDKLHTEQYKAKPILVGKAGKKDLEKKPYNEWFDANYRDSRLNPTVISQLKPVIKQYDFTVIMGTWCSDSQKQVPVFFKVLDATGYHKNVPVYCVPRKYKYYKPVKKYQIVRVPTIIVYKNGEEKGRIIEYPMHNIETDLLKIMTTDTYRHELDERE